MWKRSVGCNVVDSSNNHIDVHIMEGSRVSWRLTCYYGYPEREKRHDAWCFLRWLVRSDNIPWCIVGDFNDMLCASDKMGPHPHPQLLLDGFKAIIDECGLLEVDLKGGDYSWEKSKGKLNWVRERLDRAFADANWWRKFPLCKLSVIHTIKSDHDPILLELVNTEFSRKQFRFKFENTWLHEPSFKEEVVHYWEDIPKIHLLPKLLSVSSFMVR
ncbi:uncharacterized protein LOC141695503 [Apium graveolens]|uniref:uncharacterized protein LOC141695503 n=1 Tax=Apium graveolens TaxID=4045 RepID=UPI003D796951